MDAFSALQVAAAVLQLVEYGVTLSTKAVEIYKSSHGSTKQVEELDSMVARLKDLNEETIAQYGTNSTPSAAEKEIVAVARKCNLTVTEFASLLQELRISGSKNVIKSFAKSLKSERKQPTLELYQKRLQNLRQELNERILRSISTQTGAMYLALQKIDKDTSGLASNLTGLKQELLNALKTNNTAQIVTGLANVEHEGKTLLFRQRILASLRFTQVRERWGRIKDAHSSTYDWIYTSEDPNVRFVEWLKRGSGIFWIEGKAGSGKSTMMKHISDHSKTKAALKRWANGRLLLTGSHYFWLRGTSLQKSYEGLLRSLLYNILREAPILIDFVCAARRDDDLIDENDATSAWSVAELLQCLRLLATEKISNKGCGVCTCLFIDGLDEYEGDKDEIIGLLNEISRSDQLKICTSSRPWEVFKQSFEHHRTSGRHLLLHEHTQDDIIAVIEAELGPHFPSVAKTRTEFDLLKAEIVEKARGVFIWVTLVLKKELVPGIRFGDDLSALRERLQGIPKDLEQYFQDMIDKIDPFYRIETARIFKICVQAEEPLPIQAVESIIGADAYDMATRAKIESTEVDWFDESTVEQVRKQINGRCLDLLEVQSPSTQDRDEVKDPDDLFTIQFLHRTVHDFLNQKEIFSALGDSAGGDFDVSLTLSSTYLHLIRRAGTLTPFIVNRWSTLALFSAADLDDTPKTRNLLSCLDRGMSHFYNLAVPRLSRHWTNHVADRSTWRDGASEGYDERGQRDFLAHLIELGLTKHAQALLSSNPSAARRKDGRPYLDYALRRCTFAQDHGLLQGPNIDMIKFLLDHQCDVNEQVWIYNGRTVFDLYVTYLYEFEISDEASKAVVWQLIQHGAQEFTHHIQRQTSAGQSAKYRREVIQDQRTRVPMVEMLNSLYGAQEAQNMQGAVKGNRSGRFSFLWRRR